MGIDSAHNNLVIIAGQKLSCCSVNGSHGRGTGCINNIIGTPDTQVAGNP